MNKAQKLAVNAIEAEANRYRFMVARSTHNGPQVQEWRKNADDLDAIASSLRKQFAQAA